MPGRPSQRWNTWSRAGQAAWNGINAFANPSFAGWPDSTNTGARIGLTPSGSVSSSSNSQVISGLDVTGTITVTHTGVIVRDCRVTCSSFVAIQTADGVNATVEYCDVIGGVGENLSGVECSPGALVQYCDIRGFENTVRMRAETITVQHNYGHGFLAPGDPHYDGFESYGGDNHLIYHNTIDLDQGDTSAVNVAPFGGMTSDNIIIDANLLRGGGWILNFDDSGGAVTNITISNNRFGTAAFGVGAFGWDPTPTGNIDDLTGENIDDELD